MRLIVTTLLLVTLAACSQPGQVEPAAANLVQNGAFSSTDGWASYFASPMTGQLMTENGAGKLNIQNADGTYWKAQLYQDVGVQPGMRHTLSFKARATAEREITVALRDGSSYEETWRETLNLTPSVQTFSYTFTASSVNQPQLIFYAGQSSKDVFIGDVTLYLVKDALPPEDEDDAPGIDPPSNENEDKDEPTPSGDPSDPYNDLYQYTGRTNTTKADAVGFLNPNTQVRARFTGTSVTASFDNGEGWSGGNQLALVIDGTVNRRTLENGKDNQSITISGLSDTAHDLAIIKYSDQSAGALSFRGLELDGQLLEPAALPSRKIEIFGDSISAGVGAGCTSDWDCGQFDAQNNYPALLGQRFGAQVYNNSIGGLAVQDGEGFWSSGSVGLETTHKSIDAFFRDSAVPWNFSRYTPDLVIMGLGVNDVGSQAFDDAERWYRAYASITNGLRNAYGSDTVFLFAAFPIGDYTAQAEPYIKTLVEERLPGDTPAYFFEFSADTLSGAPGNHPNKRDHAQIAAELSTFIETIPELGW